MPKDRITGQHQGYGFVEFMGEEDADYAIKIMNMIKLYGKPIRVNKVRFGAHQVAGGNLVPKRSRDGIWVLWFFLKIVRSFQGHSSVSVRVRKTLHQIHLSSFLQASAHQKNLDIGANIFIGNLDPEVDEKLLYDTFSAFGIILQVPKVSFEIFDMDDTRSFNPCFLSDHARSRKWKFERIRFHQFRQFRSQRCGYGGDEWTVPVQPTDLRFVRVQERGEGRKTRNGCW